VSRSNSLSSRGVGPDILRSSIGRHRGHRMKETSPTALYFSSPMKPRIRAPRLLSAEGGECPRGKSARHPVPRNAISIYTRSLQKLARERLLTPHRLRGSPAMPRVESRGWRGSLRRASRRHAGGASSDWSPPPAHDRRGLIPLNPTAGASQDRRAATSPPPNRDPSRSRTSCSEFSDYLHERSHRYRASAPAAREGR